MDMGNDQATESILAYELSTIGAVLSRQDTKVAANASSFSLGHFFNSNLVTPATSLIHIESDGFHCTVFLSRPGSVRKTAWRLS